MPRILFIPAIFLASTLGLYFLATSLPEMKETPKVEEVDADVIITDPDADSQHPISSRLHFPTNLDELRSLAKSLRRYHDHNHLRVFIIFSAAFVYKQTFSIPGSALLNMLAGAVFGTVMGFPLVCVLTAFGATMAYLMTRAFAASIVESYFPDRLAALRHRVAEERKAGSLFLFLLFARLFPVTPNWMLNIASPLAGVTLAYFIPTIGLGLVPYNFICVSTGSILSEIRSVEDVFTWEVIMRLCGVSSVALALALFRRRRKKPDL